MNFEKFVLQDDYETKCAKCNVEQNEIELSIEEIPKDVILHAVGWCDFRVLECPSCKQQAIQFMEYKDRYD